MTKEQKAKRKMMESVAKHLRFKVPTKNAVIKGQKIEYFQGEENNMIEFCMCPLVAKDLMHG
jgi:hypothetical protein